MNPFIGKPSHLQRINMNGTILKGDGTRLVSDFKFGTDYGVPSDYHLSIAYQIKDGRNYGTLFSIVWYGSGEKDSPNYRRSKIFLKNLKITDFTPANEKKILKLNKKSFDGTYFKDAYASMSIPNPIILCQIPFLEDSVKNWILTTGIQDLTSADIKNIVKSIKIG